MRNRQGSRGRQEEARAVLEVEQQRALESAMADTSEEKE